MKKTWILTLASLSLSVFALAANPEADAIQTRPSRGTKAPATAARAGSQSYLLEKRGPDGKVLGRYEVTGGVSPDKLPGLIEQFQKTGKAKGIKAVAASSLTRKNPNSPNSEAESDVSKQSWFSFHAGLRIGGYPGAGYYGGHWPSTYYGHGNYGCYPVQYYQQPVVCYQQAWSYRWTYGCNGYNYGIYY